MAETIGNQSLAIPAPLMEARAARMEGVQQTLETGLVRADALPPELAAAHQSYYGATLGNIGQVRQCCPYPPMPPLPFPGGMPIDPMYLMMLMQQNQQMMMMLLMMMMMQGQGGAMCRCMPWMFPQQPQQPPCCPPEHDHEHPAPVPTPEPTPDPTPAPDANEATRHAVALHEAISGPGTDEAALMRALAGRSNAEIAEIKRAYEQMYGEKLEDAVAGDTSGDFETLLLEILKGQKDEQKQSDPTRDATALHHAISGWGTDEEALIRVLANRTPEQIREIARVYEQMHGESLEDAIAGDTSGHFEDGLLALVRTGTQGAQPAPARPSAPAAVPGAVPGAPPAPAAPGQTPRPADPVRTPEQEQQRAREEARRTAGTRNATALHEAISGAGTDEAALIRILTNASNGEIAETKRAYQEMYGENLEDAVRGDTSGNFETTLLGLLQGNRDESGRVDPQQVTRDATALRTAVAGLGTDDNALITLLTGRSTEQIRAISAAYEQMYGERLEDAVRGDTSGWYEEALVAQLNRPVTTGR